MYDDLVARLRSDSEPVSVSAFPDGSVDTFHEVWDGDERVASRERFAEAVAAGRDSFRLDHVRTAPGGQAVNAARQADALGDDVLLVGHLDHEVLSFGFETASMGAPPDRTVCQFDVDDLLLARESPDVAQWDLDDLRRAAPGGLERLFGADAVCCMNWATLRNMTDALATVGRLSLDGGVFVLDPGPLVGASERRLVGLFEALSALATSFSVVVSVNEDEAGRLVTVLDGDDGSRAERLSRVREACDADAVVAHERDAATAVTRDGTVVVPNLDTQRVQTDTGAGDRFGAGLAHGLGSGWDWETSLALGNTCASYFVVNGHSGDRASLAAHADVHGAR